MLIKAGLSFLLISIFFFADLSAIFSNLKLHAQTIPPVSLNMNLEASVPAPEGIFSVPVKLSTADKNIYSVQADINFPTDILKLESIDYSSSSFPLEVVSKETSGQI